MIKSIKDTKYTNGLSKKTRRVKAKKVKLDYEKMTYEEMMLKNAPHICFGISFVEYGYQADIWVQDNEKEDTYVCSSECRDFGDDYKIKDLIAEFKEKLEDLVEENRKSK